MHVPQSCGSVWPSKLLVFSAKASEWREQRGLRCVLFKCTGRKWRNKPALVVKVWGTLQVVMWGTRTGWTPVCLNLLLKPCSAWRTLWSDLVLGPQPRAISNSLNRKRGRSCPPSHLCGFVPLLLSAELFVGRGLSCWEAWEEQFEVMVKTVLIALLHFLHV